MPNLGQLIAQFDKYQSKEAKISRNFLRCRDKVKSSRANKENFYLKMRSFLNVISQPFDSFPEV